MSVIIAALTTEPVSLELQQAGSAKGKAGRMVKFMAGHLASGLV